MPRGQSIAPEEQEVNQVADLDFAVVVEVRTNLVPACAVIDCRQAIVVERLWIGATRKQADARVARRIGVVVQGTGVRATNHAACARPWACGVLVGDELRHHFRFAQGVDGATADDPIEPTPCWGRQREGLQEGRQRPLQLRGQEDRGSLRV